MPKHEHVTARENEVIHVAGEIVYFDGALTAAILKKKLIPHIVPFYCLVIIVNNNLR